MGEGLFPSAARFNHACGPNVGLSFDSWGCLVASAAWDAAQGEELFISYVGVGAAAAEDGFAAAAAAAAEDGFAAAAAAAGAAEDGPAAAAAAAAEDGPAEAAAAAAEDGPAEAAAAAAPSTTGLVRGTMLEPRRKTRTQQLQSPELVVGGSLSAQPRGASGSARAERRGRLLRTYLFECDCDLCARGI